MMGEVQYGGRVTDDYDKRLLNTYCKVWFGEHMFQEAFNFYKGYSIPLGKTIEQFRDAIDDLPLVDTPQVFGLHPNADITYQSNMAQSVLQTIMSIQPKDSSGGGGETRETIVYRLANDMLEKLPRDYVPHEVCVCVHVYIYVCVCVGVWVGGCSWMCVCEWVYMCVFVHVVCSATCTYASRK